MKERTDRERKDLFLFAKDLNLSDKQIDIVLQQYESGDSYEDLINLIRFVSAHNKSQNLQASLFN
jgi:hypothetical protein